MTYARYFISIAALAMLTFFPAATFAWLFAPDVPVHLVAAISLIVAIVVTTATVLVTSRHKN